MPSWLQRRLKIQTLSLGSNGDLLAAHQLSRGIGEVVSARCRHAPRATRRQAVQHVLDGRALLVYVSAGCFASFPAFFDCD